MKATDKKIASLFAEAKRIAGICLGQYPGLPDASEVNSLACALLAAGLVKAPGRALRVDHAGQDSDQDAALGRAYGDE